MKLIPDMVLNTVINLKIVVIYRMPGQNLVKHTTIMERHINYCKNLNLRFWNILRYVLLLFFWHDKDSIKGYKRNQLLKQWNWINQNHPKLSHKSKKKQNKNNNNKKKTEASRSSNFFCLYNRQHFFEIWFEVYIVLRCSLLQTSQHQYLLANWSFNFDIKK